MVQGSQTRRIHIVQLSILPTVIYIVMAILTSILKFFLNFFIQTLYLKMLLCTAYFDHILS